MPSTAYLNPENVIGTDSPASILQFEPCKEGEEPVLSRYNIVVYVFQDAPAEVSYNCECDDDYPRKTLAQMREYLMIRLGWGAMVVKELLGIPVATVHLAPSLFISSHRQPVLHGAPVPA